QLVWQLLWIDDLDDGYSTVGFEENNTYRARIGARLYSNVTFNAMQWQPYIKGNLLRYFGDRDETTFEGGTVMATNVGQTSGQVAAGVIGKLNQFSSVYAGLSYQANLDSNDQRIVTCNVGFQLNW
ncbi:MAG TPA: autotransporter outer membrane beta-barrel domain-containing protein, partial [Methylophilaceae bacterium]|nr:autotransporter outer membrane beta-barrel domain-containing protein [Methylophilaceae bacterium]